MHLPRAFLALLPAALAAEQTPLMAEPLPKPVPIPQLGFGTWNLRISPENTTAAVAAAIEAGYRHIDCASGYSNQKEVGKGIAEGLKRVEGLKRKDLWITSKLWNVDHAPGKVEKALDKTLDDLGLDYLDLYLMHWPVGNTGPDGNLTYDYIPTWHALEKLLPTNKTKHIGVCNFSPRQLYQLIKNSTVRPAVHQMELHPYLQQTWWVKQHQAHGIALTAYSPLGDTNPTYHKDSDDEGESKPRLLDNPVLKKIAATKNCTVAQIALKWGTTRGTAVIPKSSHVERIKENLESEKCELSLLDIIEIRAVGVKYLERFNNPSDGWGVELFKGLDGVAK